MRNSTKRNLTARKKTFATFRVERRIQVSLDTLSQVVLLIVVVRDIETVRRDQVVT